MQKNLHSINVQIAREKFCRDEYRDKYVFCIQRQFMVVGGCYHLRDSSHYSDECEIQRLNYVRGQRVFACKGARE